MYLNRIPLSVTLVARMLNNDMGEIVTNPVHSLPIAPSSMAQSCRWFCGYLLTYTWTLNQRSTVNFFSDVFTTSVTHILYIRQWADVQTFTLPSQQHAGSSVSPSAKPYYILCPVAITTDVLRFEFSPLGATRSPKVCPWKVVLYSQNNPDPTQSLHLTIHKIKPSCE